MLPILLPQGGLLGLRLQLLLLLGPGQLGAAGAYLSCELQEGAYVVRSEGPTPEDTIYLHLLDFGPRRKVKFTFEPRK